MDLFQRIQECKEEEVDSIIEKAIEEANQNAQSVEKLGFLGGNKSNSLFKGFIPLKTRIKYSNLNIEDYGMETTDFIYEFAHFIKKENIKTKGMLVYGLEYFINHYFGYPGKIDRETIFGVMVWQRTQDDDEYFEELKKNKIGDLKGTGAAECSERAALAQQILSLFGIESYFCTGCAEFKERQEAHCFNIVKRKDDYAILDYSIPVALYDEEGKFKIYCPFIGELSNAEFLEFINDGNIKSFDEYFLKKNGSEKKLLETKRRYVVGKYVIEPETKNVNNI